MLAAVSEGKEAVIPPQGAQGPLGGGDGEASAETLFGAWGMVGAAVGVAGLGLAAFAVGAAARRRGHARLLPQGPEDEEFPSAEYVLAE